MFLTADLMLSASSAQGLHRSLKRLMSCDQPAFVSLVRRRTDIVHVERNNPHMDNLEQARVIAVDRFDGGVIVTFADNRDALYPASFLYDSLPLVQELHETEPDLSYLEETSEDGDGLIMKVALPRTELRLVEAVDE